MSEPAQGTRTCPHCGTQTADGSQTLCPNCGAALPPLPAPSPAANQAQKAAPPLPVLTGPDPVTENLLTKRQWLDITIGVIGTLLLVALFGVGIIVAPILYYVYRGRFPALARGIRYGGMVCLFLVFAPLVVCLGLLGFGGLGI